MLSGLIADWRRPSVFVCVCVTNISCIIPPLQALNPKPWLHSGTSWPNGWAKRHGPRPPCRTRYMNWTERSVGTTSTTNPREVRHTAGFLRRRSLWGFVSVYAEVLSSLLAQAAWQVFPKGSKMCDYFKFPTTFQILDLDLISSWFRALSHL